MDVLIINQQEVSRLLPMPAAIEAMGNALAALARNQAIQPLRPVMWLPQRTGALGMMPGYLAPLKTMGIKVVSVFPGNAGTRYDSHQGAVLLFETEHGRLLAIIDATEITAIRTAATSAVATDALARPEARTLAILGSGVQARSHLAAMRAVRPLEQVRIWSRTQAHAERFVDRERFIDGPPLETAATVRQAVKDADIICTTTAASEPILQGEMLRPGAHINAVGSSVPFARELATSAVLRAALFVDRKESTINEAGDFLFPKKEGAIDEDHIVAEIGEILIGEHPGRRSDEEITLFKSLGLAIEDVAAAHHIYTQARELGIGTMIELGGSRHES